MALAAAAITRDQATKAFALVRFVSGQPGAAAPNLNPTLGLNETQAPGSLRKRGPGEAKAILTGLLTFVVAGRALIVGGSLSGILDQLWRGTVTDFLDIFWQVGHWPASNPADMAIVCGAGLVQAGQAPRQRQESLYG